MAVKYVKDFAFDSGFGFTGSTGKTPVRAYMRGGPVKPVKESAMLNSPSKFPKIEPAMVGKPAKNAGGKTSDSKKLAAYNKPHTETKKGAKVAMYAKGGQVKKGDAKKPMPAFLKAKMMKKAEGGDIEDPRAASIKPGDSSPLNAIRYNQYGEADPFEGRGARYEAGPTPPQQDYPEMPLYISEKAPPGIYEETDQPEARRGFNPSVPLNQYGEADPFEGRGARDESYVVTGGRQPVFDEAFLDQSIRRDRERMLGDAAQQMRDLAAIQAREQAAMNPMPLEPMPGVVQPNPVNLVEPVPDVQRRSGDMLYKWDDGTYHYRQQLFPGQEEEGYNPDYLSGDYYRNLSKEALAAKSEPAMARAVRNVGAGRNVGLSDLMSAARNTPRRAFAPFESESMVTRPRTPVNMYAKGGKVSKGQAKIGKVMGEFKRGELHSGSKKGPMVKSEKQATAIALSEARKAGAKIPVKKNMGGKACG